MEQSVINCEGDQKKLFSLIHSLFGSKKITVLPEYTSSFTLASLINMFFIEKIHNIKMEHSHRHGKISVIDFMSREYSMLADICNI